MKSSSELVRVRVCKIPVFLLIVSGLGAATCHAGNPRADQDDADLHAITRVGRSVAWAVGDRGVAWSSRDSGRTWLPVVLPGRIACRSVCFLSNRVGWIAGTDERPGQGRGVVLATRDGGVSWQTVHPPLDRICHVRFFDLEHGLVVGGGEKNPSGVLETLDGGRSWRAITGSASKDWRAAAFATDRQGVLGGGGLRMATLAEGALLGSGTQAGGRRAWWGCAVGDQGNGWLVGDAAGVLVRPLRQASWQTPDTPLPGGLFDAMSFRCVASVGNKAWLAGVPGSVTWYTPDNGHSWERQSTGQPLPLYGISMGHDGTGVAVGALGVIIRTQDGGRHWEVVRGGARRLAMLVIHVTARTLPLGLLARDSADLGYRSGGVLLSATASQWRHADRTVRALGGQGVEAGWRLRLDEPELAADAKRLEQTWQAATEGRLHEWLVGRIVGLIRMWRPSVLVIDAARSDNQAAGLVRQATRQAIEHAADPTRWAVQASLTGLAPWATRRLFERTTLGEMSAVRVVPDTTLPRLGAVVGTLVQQGRLHQAHTDAVPWNGDSLKRLKGTGKINGDSACQGLGLAAGSAARRRVSLPGQAGLATADTSHRATRALSAWIRLAEAGTRPPEALQAELMPLLRPLGKTRAGWCLWMLAEQFRDSGNLPLAESLLSEVIDGYPDHEVGPAAAARLLPSLVSQERRWQRLRHTGRHEGLASSQITRDFADDQPRGLRFVTRGTRQPLRVAEKSDWQTKMTRAEVDRAIQLARHLKQHAEGTYDSAKTQLTLATMFRARGSNRLAEACYRRLSHRDGPWRSTAVQETWLAIRSGTPPADSTTCRTAVARPIVDGVISDPCWEDVPELRLRPHLRSVSSGNSGFVVTTCDDEYLYLAARLDRPVTKRVGVSTSRTFDADHSGFDRLAIFLDIDRDYQVGYVLTVDERGEVSERCGGDASWNPRCVVAIDSDDQAWRLEMAIRWTELAPGRPAPGTCWGMRLVRTLPAEGWQGWGGTADHRGAPVIGAGFLSFPATRTALRRR